MASVGIVQDVTWRHTTIENSVGERVVIPNSIINKTALVKLRPLSVVTIPVVVTVDGGKLTETAESMRAAADKAASGVCALEKEARVCSPRLPITRYRGTLTFAVVDAAEAAAAKDAVLRAIAPLVHTEKPRKYRRARTSRAGDSRLLASSARLRAARRSTAFTSIRFSVSFRPRPPVNASSRPARPLVLRLPCRCVNFPLLCKVQGQNNVRER